MVYAYRLKGRKKEGKGCSVESVAVAGEWKFTSDSKISAALRKWPGKVLVLEAEDIASLKAKTQAYDSGDTGSDGDPSKKIPSGISDSPLAKELEGKTLAELKEFAKEHGFDEAEYSRLTKTGLVEYIVLGMSARANGS